MYNIFVGMVAETDILIALQLKTSVCLTLTKNLRKVEIFKQAAKVRVAQTLQQWSIQPHTVLTDYSKQHKHDNISWYSSCIAQWQLHLDPSTTYISFWSYLR